MAYFKLNTNTPVQCYPYDYHSHFGGIMLVDGGEAAKVTYEIGNDAQATRWPKGRMLSLVGLLGGVGDDAADKGHYELFVYALRWMETHNPFVQLAAKPAPVLYERGECAAENVYIACVLLAQRCLLPEDLVAASAGDARLYGAVREVALPMLARTERSWLRGLLRYFNRKIYSANKFTPFDDVYKTRSSMLKMIWESDRALYQQWMLGTYAYLFQSGVSYNQVAIGTDEIENAAAVALAFNAAYQTRYTLIAHTPGGYVSPEALREDLNEKIKPLLTSAAMPTNIVGLDLLGTENKVANYGTLFSFLLQLSREPALPFGPGERALKMVVHIHCGEGAGAGSDNRSYIGYATAYSTQALDREFYRALSAYIVRAGYNASIRQVDAGRVVVGAPRPKPDKPDAVSGLFDELFLANALTWRGTQLRRFDINSPLTQQRVAYHGKRNAMAMAEALETKPGHESDDFATLLMGPKSLYAMRLGHDFYYRSYMAAKFENLAFDTNLGSNAITGAAGLFGSRETYHINRGFRHLEGYIDTDVLVAASDAVAYMGADALSEGELETLRALSREQGSLAEILDRNQAKITAMLDGAMSPLRPVLNPDQKAAFDNYKNLVLAVVGELPSRVYGFQGMARVLTVFRNWRSYLLGADGQGVEHTDMQNEFLRMLFLVAYNLLPSSQNRIDASLMSRLQEVMLWIAGAYWRTTMGDLAEQRRLPETELVVFEGFKAPASVVVVRRHGARNPRD